MLSGHRDGEIAGKPTAIRPPARYLHSEMSDPVKTPIACPECGTPRGIAATRTSVCGFALRLGLALVCSLAALLVLVFFFGEVTSTPWVNQAFNFGADGEVLTLGELRRVAAGQETPGFRVPEILASETATLAVDVQQAFPFDSRTREFGWPAGTFSWFSHAINGAVATGPSRWSSHLGTFHRTTGSSGWSISVWPVLFAAAVAVMVWAAARAVCSRVRWSSEIRAERWSLAIGIASGIFLAFVPWSSHDSNRSGVIGPDIPLKNTAMQLFQIKDSAHRARELAVLTVRALESAPYSQSEMRSAPYVPEGLRRSWSAGGMAAVTPELAAPRPDSAILSLFVHQEDNPTHGTAVSIRTPLHSDAIHANQSSNVFGQWPPRLMLTANASNVHLFFRGNSGSSLEVSFARLAITQFLVWLLLPVAVVALFRELRLRRDRKRSVLGQCVECGYDLRGMPAGSP